MRWEKNFHLCRQEFLPPLPAEVPISRQHCRLNICSYFGCLLKYILLCIFLSISRGSTDTDSQKEGPVPLYHISDIRTIGLHYNALAEVAKFWQRPTENSSASMKGNPSGCRRKQLQKICAYNICKYTHNKYTNTHHTNTNTRKVECLRPLVVGWNNWK